MFKRKERKNSLKKAINALIMISALAGLLGLTACSDSNNNNNQSGEDIKVMGAGSSFIYPAMSRWSNNYYQNSNVQVNYQPIGSGGGQRQIFQRTVDFAASDQPLTSALLKEHKLIQFPMIIGGIVPVVHITGIGSNELTLNGSILADIYMGDIRYWDNPKIKALNPDLNLKHELIIPVRRADGSGTTYNFSDYLSKVSETWQAKIGVNTTLNWPSITIGAKGNAGVAAQVLQLPNSIGYIEYAYAKSNQMAMVKLVNHNGKVITPNISSFRSSAEYANWSSKNDYQVILTNQKGNNSWPIDATTFILLPTDNKPQINQTILAFLSFAYGKKGQEIASKLDYIGIPNQTVSEIKNYWKERLPNSEN